MADIALLSELTWRSLEMQRAAYPDYPHFIAPDEIDIMLRPSSRADDLHIHTLSLAVIADCEKDFVGFLKGLKKRKAWLHSKEEEIVFHNCTSGRHFDAVVKAWKQARRHGVQKIGGKISARKREADSKEKADLIRDRWPLPNKTWRTPVLLREVDLSYNTARKFLGPRPIAQYNYQAKLKRKKLKEERANG